MNLSIMLNGTVAIIIESFTNIYATSNKFTTDVITRNQQANEQLMIESKSYSIVQLTYEIDLILLINNFLPT